jgi:hypothetical protein
MVSKSIICLPISTEANGHRPTPEPPGHTLEETRASTIVRSKKSPSLLRLYESMNRPAARSKAYVVVERRPRMFPCCFDQDPSPPIGEARENADPLSLGQHPHLEKPPPNTNKGQRHIEKQILLDQKNGKKTRLSI